VRELIAWQVGLEDEDIEQEESDRTQEDGVAQETEWHALTLSGLVGVGQAPKCCYLRVISRRLKSRLGSLRLSVHLRGHEKRSGIARHYRKRRAAGVGVRAGGHSAGGYLAAILIAGMSNFNRRDTIRCVLRYPLQTPTGRTR
jgi:hypothetical protein